MDALFRTSGGPSHSGASLRLPFQSSFGPPTPPTTSIGLGLNAALSGEYKRGPYKLINASLTQHFIATTATNDRSEHSIRSPIERLNDLDVGQLVFSNSKARIAMGGANSVEFFSYTDVNAYLEEFCDQFKDAQSVKSKFNFVGVIKNTVTPNGSTAYPRNVMNSRMLNVVVSQKASICNVFTSKILSGQKLWFVIRKKEMRRKRKYAGSDRQTCYQLEPWTSSDSDHPTPIQMHEWEAKEEDLIYIGRSMECFDEMRSPGSRASHIACTKGIDMRKLDIFVKV